MADKYFLTNISSNFETKEELIKSQNTYGDFYFINVYAGCYYVNKGYGKSSAYYVELNDVVVKSQ